MFQSSTLIASLRNSWSEVVATFPDLALALVLLIAGWMGAKLVRRVAIRTLKAMRVDDLAERMGVDDFLVQGGVKLTTITLLAGALYWLILGGVFVALLDALGLRTANVLLDRMSNFVPNLILSIGILLFL